jgi:hypothetical protein
MVQRIIFTSTQGVEVEKLLDTLGFDPMRQVRGYIETRRHPSINHGHTFMASYANAEPAPKNIYGLPTTQTRVNIHEARDNHPETESFSKEGADLYKRLLTQLEDAQIVTSIGNIVNF